MFQHVHASYVLLVAGGILTVTVAPLAAAKAPPPKDREAQSAPAPPRPDPSPPPAHDTPKAQTNRPAPDFALSDLRGSVVTSDYLSRPVTVVHFWASWCVPCIREIPDLNRLAQRYEPSGAALYAVAVGSGSVQELRQIEKSFRIQHRVLVGDDRLANEFGGVSAFPVTFLVDNRGWIVERHDGATREAQQRIEETIRGMLAAAGRPLPKR